MLLCRCKEELILQKAKPMKIGGAKLKGLSPWMNGYDSQLPQEKRYSFFRARRDAGQHGKETDINAAALRGTLV